MKHLLFIYIIIICLGQHAVTVAQNKSTTTIDSVKTMDIKVKGVTCANDLITISNRVNKIKGVRNCEASKPGAVTVFKISYSPDCAKLEEIYQEIESTPGCENPDERPYKIKNK